MSTAVPLPLDTLNYHAPLPVAAHAGEAEALRRAVAERLEQHRRRRNPNGARHSVATVAQTALPGMEHDAPWTSSASNRIADSVAARFAKSQSYRDFLQQEAETATRQAEAAAEIARRNADAVAAAQQQLMEEMREWEARQNTAPTGFAAAELSTSFAEPAAAEAAAVLPMQAHVPPQDSMSVLAPSEASRTATPEPVMPATAVPSVPASSKPANVPAVEAATTAAPAPAVSIKIALGLEEPTEPPTPIPANLIEFPRQLVAARKARPRLAEGPLRDEADAVPERAQLRIFEVEASSFSTTPAAETTSSLPEWSTIRLDSVTEPHDLALRDAEVSFALPIHAAPLERRMLAAVVDGCCIATAFLLAVAAAGLAGSALPTGIVALGASAVTLLLFAVGYMLLSFTLSGQTAGMRYARIALCTFGDDNPSRGAMRRRLFAMGLSTVSLGLGFAWALLDDDKLGWHDRISRMYQRAY